MLPFDYTAFDAVARVSVKTPVVTVVANDTNREELDEFAACIRGGGMPDTDGWWATRNLAVVMAVIRSAREGRAVDVAPLVAG